MKRRDAQVHVSDHAVLRWLEREHGIDVEAVRQHLADQSTDAAALGAVALQIGKVRLVLVDAGICATGVSVVIPTVLPRETVGLKPWWHGQ